MTDRVMRLGAAVEHYLSRRENRFTHNTMVTCRSTFNSLVRALGPSTPMRSLRPDQLEDYYCANLEGGISPKLAASTYNKDRARVALFLKYCERRGWVAPLLMEDVVPRDEPEVNRRRYSATELCRLVDSAETEQEKILASLVTNTALRIADVLKLRMCPVDDRGDLDRQTKTVDLSAGSLRVRIYKTSKVDELPITSELDSALRRWLTHYSQAVGPLEDGMLLVPAVSVGGFPGSPRVAKIKPYSLISNPNVKYDRLTSLAELPRSKGDGWHTLRRSFARIFYEEIKRVGHPDPIKPVQAMLHHSNSKQTYYYIGVDVDRATRNDVLRGKLFLTRLAVDTSNVTQIGGAHGA